MFTGLVEELGKVRSISVKNDGLVLSIEADKVLENTKLGDSIAVNGVCLTVVSIEGKILFFEVSKETVKRSNISKLKPSDFVNLERAMSPQGRFGGHIVQGHVDCTGYIAGIKPLGNHTEFEVEIPSQYLEYIIEKGSIAVDGISLTINYIVNNKVKLNIIPHTLENTNLKYRKIGDEVNIEFDILGKYVVETMKRYGFSKEDKLKKLIENF
ncbi:MAG: riboflavin synthase [Hydrogenothermaceae bacterium]|nr:riboflavin synthase [Hydrogenothermaceae bacterium]